MSRYNQYNNFYDPVGSQANQPSGYTYQPATSAAYPSSYQSYGSQQYASNAPQVNNSASHAAAALSSLSSQEYSQTPSHRASSGGQYDNSQWLNSSNNTNLYGSNTLAPPNRTQHSSSPHYPSTQSSSTFGRLSVPEQSQAGSNTLGNTQRYQNPPSSAGVSDRSYQTAYPQPQPQQMPPPRYNSPLHAVQAQQHGHTKQPSRDSNHLPSPHVANAARTGNRQPSASVEPSPTTVDPSQVYDNRAELQRKAQIEAEKRRKYEAEQAAKKAEEERIAEKTRKKEEDKRKAEEEAAAAAAKKQADQQRRNEQRRKAREQQKQSKSAATTLQQMASATSSAPPANDEEAEMRAMFQKMREFNAKNPSLLAKMWDEERRTHEDGKSSSPATSSKAPAQQSTPAAASPSGAPPAPAQQQPTNIRPFKKPDARATPAASEKQSTPQHTQQPPQQQPQQQPTTSLWPPHKKGALADAAANWLTSLPQDAGKTITAPTILNILNTNPSYVQLCEALEALGMNFDRSFLARELLRAVPDGLKAHSGPQAQTAPLANVNGTAAQVNGAAKGSPDTPNQKAGLSKGEAERRAKELMTNAVASGTVNYEAPLSLMDAAREVNSMGKPYGTYGSPAQQTEPSPYFKPPRTQTNGSRPVSQSRPPTDVKPEERPEEPPRPPADKEEAARKRTFGDLVDLTQEDSDDEAPPLKKQQLQQQQPDAPSNGNYRDPLAYLAKPTNFNQFMYRDAKASGRGQGVAVTPTIQSQQQRSSGVTQQPTPPPRPRGPQPEQLQLARMKGKMLVEPIMRDRVARKSSYDKRTIARDVLLATGRHPDMRALNAHLGTMQKLLGHHGWESDVGSERGNRSDLSTIKWDVIDAAPPEKPKEAKDDEKAEDEKGHARSSAKPPSESPATGNNSPPVQGPEAQTSQKRRARKPKSAYSGPAAPTADAESSPIHKSLGNASTPPTSRPATRASASNPPSSSTMAASGKPMGYAAFQQIGPDGQKKKGRPVGWRKNIHSREAQGLTPARSHHSKPNTTTITTGARTSKPPQEVQPQYPVFKCEWAGCKSELHNFDTLKKHIVKMHCKESDDAYECLWKGCTAAASMNTIEAWLGHVNRAHLNPIAWRLGDGPRSDVSPHSSKSTTPAYLTDFHGRSITPIITPTHLQPASSPIMSSASGPGQPTKDGIPKPVAVTGFDVELRKLEQYKRAVGPTLDRMGCVLVDEGRRKTFLDDEDFEAELDGGDE